LPTTPEKLREIRASTRWAAEHEAIDAELDSIARASEPDGAD